MNRIRTVEIKIRLNIVVQIMCSWGFMKLIFLSDRHLPAENCWHGERFISINSLESDLPTRNGMG